MERRVSIVQQHADSYNCIKIPIVSSDHLTAIFYTKWPRINDR